MMIRLDQRPAMNIGARLRFDPLTSSYVLLSPERGLRLNASANEVLQRCNGQLTVGEIIAQLVDSFSFASPAGASVGVRSADTKLERHQAAQQVTRDVLELLTALHQRSLLKLDPA